MDGGWSLIDIEASLRAILTTCRWAKQVNVIVWQIWRYEIPILQTFHPTPACPNAQVPVPYYEIYCFSPGEGSWQLAFNILT